MKAMEGASEGFLKGQAEVPFLGSVTVSLLASTRVEGGIWPEAFLRQPDRLLGDLKGDLQS